MMKVEVVVWCMWEGEAQVGGDVVVNLEAVL